MPRACKLKVSTWYLLRAVENKTITPAGLDLLERRIKFMWEYSGKDYESDLDLL